MRFFTTVACLLATAWQATASSDHIDFSKYSTSDIITRDVCIIGGGASGTYAAIRLRQQSRTVAVVEKQSQLGGHTTTYVDPRSGKPVNYGVTYFEDDAVTHDYFGHFGIPLTAADPPGEEVLLDFAKGEEVRTPSAATQQPAIQSYLDQLRRFSFLRSGINLPQPVPEDLLLTFGDFMKKYGLMPAASAFATFNNDLGDWASKPTLYTLKYYNEGVFSGAMNGYLQPVDHNNTDLYIAAQNELADDVLLDSSVTKVQRDSDPFWTYTEVDTPAGPRLIRAKKILVTVPPLVDHLRFLGLSRTEEALFAQFDSTYLYTAVVRVQGLPDNMTFTNQDSDNPFFAPRLPALYMVRNTEVPDLKTIHLGSDAALSESDVRKHIMEGFLQLKRAGLDLSFPEIEIVGDHSPYALSVSAKEIASGFYAKLNALQGYHRTYYTGAAFENHNSPHIWRWTDELIREKMLGGLDGGIGV